MRSAPIKVAAEAFCNSAAPFKRAVLFTPVRRTETSAKPAKNVFFETALKTLRFTLPSTVRLLMPSSVNAFDPLTTIFEPPPENLALSTTTSFELNFTEIGSVAIKGVSPICKANWLNCAVPLKFSVENLRFPSAPNGERLPSTKTLPVAVPLISTFSGGRASAINGASSELLNVVSALNGKFSSAKLTLAVIACGCPWNLAVRLAFNIWFSVLPLKVTSPRAFSFSTTVCPTPLKFMS